MTRLLGALGALLLLGGGCAKGDPEPTAAAPQSDPAPAEQAAPAAPDTSPAVPAPMPQKMEGPAHTLHSGKPLEDERAVAVAQAIVHFNAYDLDALAPLLAEQLVYRRPGAPERAELQGRPALIAAARSAIDRAWRLHVSPKRFYLAGDQIIADVVVHGWAPAHLERKGRHFSVTGLFAFHVDAQRRINRVEAFFDHAVQRMQVREVPTPAGLGELLLAAPKRSLKAPFEGARDAENEALVTALLGAIATDTLDGAWDRLVAPDYTFHIINYVVRPKGRAQNLAFLRDLRRLWRGWSFDTNQVLSVHDRVFTWTTHSATYAGGFDGVDGGGQALTLHALTMWTVADGRVKEASTYFDGSELLAALGLPY